ncbi:hypothetical protein J2I47_06085 [Fibrella sp. HMF5335]|uniref:Lycopene beta-cyclase n=1 Tax=Fibrella rubiginis TaxID=2817060 RepID=A0A939GEP3_9BACT|nr:lycopene cyclase family protein [Fibrella rubiginis]MBO0936110.1 hypothetical protein [Fibrella rubiginis]
MRKTTYDIAVVGAGCAGYQLLYQLAQQPAWSSWRVLLLSDGVPLQRSWCFWGTDDHPLQHLVTKSWTDIEFQSPDFGQTQPIAPYTYHYIAGEAFFRYFEKTFLPANPNIQVVQAEVRELTQANRQFTLVTEDATFWAKQVFSSRHQTPVRPGRWNLSQHFRGWFVRTETPVFREHVATLMDFRVPQQDAVQFAYVLPFSDNEALIEITAFSRAMAYTTVRYDDMLADYISRRYPGVMFSVESTEQGQIPMTDYPFTRFGPAGEMLLGTAAGMVKATTGYAFRRIGHDCTQLANAYGNTQPADWPITTGRFRFYDRLLLGILTEQPGMGLNVFSRLYRYTSFRQILQFLDEESSLLAEVSMISRLPYVPFLSQLVKQWKH